MDGSKLIEILLKVFTLLKAKCFSFYAHLFVSTALVSSCAIVALTVLFYVMIFKFAYILLREELSSKNRDKKP